MSFAEDSKGTIWIGSFLSGLYSYNPDTRNFTHHQETELKEQYIDSKILISYLDSETSDEGPLLIIEDCLC